MRAMAAEAMQMVRSIVAACENLSAVEIISVYPMGDAAAAASFRAKPVSQISAMGSIQAVMMISIPVAPEAAFIMEILDRIVPRESEIPPPITGSAWSTAYWAVRMAAES